jgi:hypothetical protein
MALMLLLVTPGGLHRKLSTKQATTEGEENKIGLYNIVD